MAIASIAVRPTAPVSSRPFVLGASPTGNRSQSESTSDSVRFSQASQAKGMIPGTGVMDLPSRVPVENPLLTPAQRQTMRSPAFANVYRNFDLLSPAQQQACLQKLALFEAKYPRFLTVLNQVPNAQYGKGFQFFFIPAENNPRWKDIPAGVRGNGGSVDYSGIVYSSPALAVLKGDSPVKSALQAVSQGAVTAFSAVKPGVVALDVGGMFTNAGADTFAHEMGHVIQGYFMSNAEQLEIWAIYSEARNTGKGFISDYAKTNHMEFFSESVEAYLRQDAQGRFVERDKLQQTNPRLFAFIRKQLEPGVSGPEATLLISAWTVARTKTGNASQAIRKLFTSKPVKKQ